MHLQAGAASADARGALLQRQDGPCLPLAQQQGLSQGPAVTCWHMNVGGAVLGSDGEGGRCALRLRHGSGRGAHDELEEKLH